MTPYEKLLKELRDGIDLGDPDELDSDEIDPAIDDAEQTMSKAADLLEASTKALLDIATCSLPNVPRGATVSMEQFGPFAMKRARDTLKIFFPSWNIKPK